MGWNPKLGSRLQNTKKGNPLKYLSLFFRWIHPTIAHKIAKFISRSGKEDMHGADFNKDVKNELQIF